VKNQFFQTHQPREGIFKKYVHTDEALFSQLFASTLSSYFGSAKHFFKNFLTEIIRYD